MSNKEYDFDSMSANEIRDLIEAGDIDEREVMEHFGVFDWDTDGEFLGDDEET